MKVEAMENSPDMVALEGLVDRIGLRRVVFGLANICHGKAEHLQANWQDASQARRWKNNGRKLDRFGKGIVPQTWEEP